MTTGERLSEMFDWMAQGRPDPEPAFLAEMEPDGRAQVTAAMNELDNTIREKSRQFNDRSTD